MYLYDGKVRVGGSVLNEVLKEDMSAAEIIILRRLHGSDAVVDLTEKAAKEGQDPCGAEERERLKTIYCKVGNERRTPVPFEQMFGPEHMELPPRLADFEKKTGRKGGGKAASNDLLD